MSRTESPSPPGLPIATAFANRKANRHSRWSPGNVAAQASGGYAFASDRLWNDVACPVQVSPKFSFGRDAKVFTIGSCFARNIEKQLAKHDVHVLSRVSVEPHWVQATSDPHGFLNKFTTASILSELEFATGERDSASSVYAFDGEGGPVCWNGLIRLARLLPPEEGIALRQAIDGMYRGLASADLVIITLGLVEAWFDADTGLGLNGPPPPPLARRYPERFRMVQTGVAQNIQALRRIRTLLERIAPAAKVVFTVSPVPLGSTFTTDDIVVANCLSKSVLRCAIDDIVRDDPRTDYYPSLEMVLGGDPARAWASDTLHVSERAVAAITKAFMGHYLG